jgi:hypothetical protein
MSDENAIDCAAVEQQLPRGRSIVRITYDLAQSSSVTWTNVSNPSEFMPSCSRGSG